MSVVFYELDGLYLVMDTGGQYLLYADGVPISLKDVLQSKPVRVYTSKGRDVTTGYRSETEFLTVGQWRGQFEELHKDYDSGLDKWNSLESEFAYRKWFDSFTREHETVTDEEDVEFLIVTLDYAQSDLPPYTWPCRLSGAGLDDRNFTLFSYTPNRLEMLDRAGQSRGLLRLSENQAKEYPQWEVPRHSEGDLQFVKLGGKYTDYKKLSAINKCVGTLSECKKTHESNLQIVADFWDAELAKMDVSRISQDSYAAVISGLTAIKSKVDSISPKSSTWDQHATAKKLIAQLMSSLVSARASSSPEQMPLGDDLANRPGGSSGTKTNDRDPLIALVKELSEAAKGHPQASCPPLDTLQKLIDMIRENDALHDAARDAYNNGAEFANSLDIMEFMVRDLRTTLDKVREAGL